MQEAEGRLRCGLSRVHIQKLRQKQMSQKKDDGSVEEKLEWEGKRDRQKKNPKEQDRGEGTGRNMSESRGWTWNSRKGGFLIPKCPWRNGDKNRSKSQRNWSKNRRTEVWINRPEQMTSDVTSHGMAERTGGMWRRGERVFQNVFKDHYLVLWLRWRGSRHPISHCSSNAGSGSVPVGATGITELYCTDRRKCSCTEHAVKGAARKLIDTTLGIKDKSVEGLMIFRKRFE